MITRTVKSVIVTAYTMDLETMTVKAHTVNLPATVRTKSAQEAYIRKAIEGDVCRWMVTGETEELWGIEEDAFFANAIKLDPETRKPING